MAGNRKIQLPESLYSENDDTFTRGVENNRKVQALVRGYFSRRAGLLPKLAEPLRTVYKTLPEFTLDTLNEFSLNLPEGHYIGEINESGLPHGKGRLTSDLQVKEGSWHNGKLNGNCRVISSNGEVFIGNFKFDVKDGFGELNGDSHYKGEFKNNLSHGKGEEKWKNGSKYQGDYIKGTRHGKGLFSWPDGSSYEGDFRNNTIEGFGVYSWTGGRSYTGQWKNNKMHGHGKFVWEDGKVYEGQYMDNEKNGFGTMTLKSGKKYEGQWKNGKQHGTGTLHYAESLKKGVWDKGKFLSASV